jgi:hypothetical protein
MKNNNKDNDDNSNTINENNNESKGETSSNNNQKLDLTVKTPFPIKFKYNFLCFIRNSFTSSGTVKQRKMVKAALNEKTLANNMVMSAGKNKTLTQIIVVKIKEYVYTTEFYTPMKILRTINQIYVDFFDNFNLNLKKIDLDNLRKIITNLIQYGIELNSVLIPFDFLIYTLYALKDIKGEEDIKKKKKKEEKKESKEEKKEEKKEKKEVKQEKKEIKEEKKEEKKGKEEEKKKKEDKEEKKEK